MGRLSGMEISSPSKIAIGAWEASLSFPQANFKVKFPYRKPKAGPFGNCIPVRVNQVMKGIEISQWPSHI